MGNDVVPTSAAMLQAESGAREAMTLIAVKARNQQIRHRIRRVGLIASRYCQVPSRRPSRATGEGVRVRACACVCMSGRVSEEVSKLSKGVSK